MEETVRGVSIRNTMDNSKVDEGLKSLKRQFGVLNSEIKANNSAFSKSEKSMAQYQTRLNGLNEKMKLQKQMFNLAEKELKQLNAEYSEAKSRVKSVENAYKQLVITNRKNKEALDKSNAAMKASNAELKKQEATYKRTEASKKKAYERLKQLRQAEKELKASNQATTTQLKRAADATQKQANKHKELVQKYKTEGAQVKKLREENKALTSTNERVSQTYSKTNTKLKQTEREYNNINKTIKNHDQNLAKAQKSVNNERASMNRLQQTIDKTAKEMNGFNKEQLIANSHFTRTANRLDKMATKFGSVKEHMTSIGRTMTIGVTTPVVAGLGAAVKTSADFEQQMSKVGAVAQSSGKELGQMKSEAVDLGAKTSKSASEVASGMNELAQLGFTAKQVMSAMPGVISAAEASGADMATTAQVMASSINSFNLKAENSGHVADVLATAANDSAADINYMGDALKYAGTPAHSLGISLEDTSAAIEVMSNAGLEGSQAGTALRASFIRLSNPTKKSQKAMDELGVSLTNSKGKFVGMPKLIEQFRDGMKGMTKEQKLANVAQIVGTEAASGFLALIDAGPNKINKYSKSLQNSDGASAKAAKRMRDNLKGALEQLGGAFESLGIKIGEDLTPMIRGAAGVVQHFVEGFSKMPGWVRKSAIAMGVFAGAIGPVLVATGLVIGAIGKAAQGYAMLNRRMAINTAEAAANAKANRVAAGSLATTGTATKGSEGKLGKFGNVLNLITGRFGKLGSAVKLAGRFIRGFGIPLSIAIGIFSVAYEKIGWFRRGFADMGKLVNQVGSSINFSWIGKMQNKLVGFMSWLKKDMAKGLQQGLLFKGIKKVFDGLHYAVSKASDSTNVFSSKVSKGTKKALGAYNRLSEQAKVKLNELRISHKKIGDKEYNQIKTLYGNINKEVNKQLDKRHSLEMRGLRRIFKGRSGLSNAEEQKILAQTQRNNNKESAQAKKINSKILAIYAKAHRERRSLTKAENNKVARLQSQLDRRVVKSLSKSEVEQKVILERMKNNKSKLSLRAAASVIKNSAKERDASIKNAKKTRDKTIGEAIKQRDQYHTISGSQARTIIRNAEKQYNKSVSSAKNQHKKVVKEAQKQNKGVSLNIDQQTGHVKSRWEIMKDFSILKARNMYKMTTKFFKQLKNSAKTTWGTMGIIIKETAKGAYEKVTDRWRATKNVSIALFRATKQGADKWYTKLGSKVKSTVIDAYKNSSNWFRRTKNKSLDLFSDTFAAAKKHWTNIANKISDKSNDAYKSSKKWFTQAKIVSLDRFKDMLQGARHNFQNIVEESNDKGKKTFGKWKSWLIATLNWIRHIKDAFGRAASDLGKAVANRAVDGLNGMIGGINKIAKAITDKTLIKPIPHLSTGTYGATASVQTDATGGMSQPTLAVVNDKGPGNAPGGGVQEVIHRANGTLEAPKGRNTIVNLNQGDSVINASDTKRYQNMGVLPRFSTGTHKRSKDFLAAVGGAFQNFAKRAKEPTHTAMDVIGGAAKHVGKAVSKGAHKAKDTASDMVEKAGEVAGSTMKGIKGIVKNVEDFMEKPRKLVDLVMSKMHINFGAGANATVQIAKGAFSKLKDALVDKVKSWFEEFGGGGGYNPFAGNKNYQFVRGWSPTGHAGVDYAAPIGTPIPSPIDGTVIQSWFSPNQPSGGNETQIYDGSQYTHILMHQSKRKVHKGQRVHQGQIIGLSGNTGNSTGPHVHWQVNRGKGYLNNHPDSINPLVWAKEAAKGGGAPKAGIKWAPQIKQALAMNGLPTTPAYVNAWARQIDSESGGNPRAVQGGYVDANTGGNEAKGLVQVAGTTFQSMHFPGHGNVFNPLDNLLAGIHWAKTAYGSRMLGVIGHGHGYENGGMVSQHQVAEIAEQNRPEMIVPLTKRNRAVQLIEQAMRYVGMDTGSTDVTVNNDNSTIEKLLQKMVMLSDQNNRLTQAIVHLVKGQDTTSDPKAAAQLISDIQGDKMRFQKYNWGDTT